MKEDKDKELNLSDNTASTALNRRDFLKLLGGGIIITFSAGDVFAQEGGRRRGFRRDEPTDFNAYLRIAEDGRVSCFTGKIEMGQGIITSLAQMLAEELNVPLSSVDMVMGDTALCPWDMGTFGSRSTKYFGPPLREAAAEAKSVLIQLAAEHLSLPQEQLEVKEGIVIDKNNSENQVSYARLTQGKKISRPLAEGVGERSEHLEGKPALKPASAFTISGKSIGRTDALEKVTGEAKYAGDIRLPEMLYARILRPPAHGAKQKNVDTSAAEKMKDVQIVRDGDLIAVLHPFPDEAEKALAKIKAQFDLPEAKLDDQTIFEHLLNVAPQGEIVAQEGDLDKGKNLTSVKFEATYLNRYVAHAPIEPHAAIAKVEGNNATVWASTQRPFGDKEAIAGALDFASKDVRVITPFVGGGFGGKTRNQQAVEAARLAKLAGKPVQVAWSREEEFFNDTFQPAAIVKISSGLNESNQIVFWDYQVYFAGDRCSQPFYDIPHQTTVSRGGWRAPDAHPFGTGAWRGPGANTNTFARESHIDVMASKAGIDPLEFRLKNLKDQRMVRVLEAVAEKFGWTSSKAPSGRGYGIACVDYLGTYVATMAEVKVDEKKGSTQVKRVVSAQDMGQVINPQGAQMQMEGGITMGLGYALTEEIHFQGGEIRDLNFDTYEIPRFSWLPKIETMLIDNPQMPPQGGGEPAITCMGGVIANAIYDAIGVRLFQLPMTPEHIKEAMNRD